MAEFLNRGRCGCADALSQSVLITLVVLFKQIQSNAMKMVQGRLTSFYSFSRETNWVSIFKYLIWNRFYTKSNEKNKLVINNLLRLTSYHRGNSPASKFLQHSRQHWILTSGLWFNKRAIFFSLIINLSRYNTYKADWQFPIIFPSSWAQTSILLLDS